MADYPDQNPTEVFLGQCVAINTAWRTGELPPPNAFDAIQRLYQEAEAEGHRGNMGRGQMYMGVIQAYRGKLDASVDHFQNALQLFSAVGNTRFIAACHLNIGEIMRQKGNYSRAQKLFHQAYEMAVQMGDAEIQMVTSSNEGLMFVNMGKPQLAWRPFQEAYRLATEWTGDEGRKVEVLCEVHYGLAVIHLDRHDPDKAWAEAWEALNLAQNVRRPMQLGLASRTVGEVLTAIENPPESASVDSIDTESYFQLAYDAFKEVEAEGEYARTLASHAHYLVKQGKQVQAGRKFRQAMVIFGRLGMVDDAAKVAVAQTGAT